jgi:hypothetical protein
MAGAYTPLPPFLNSFLAAALRPRGAGLKGLPARNRSGGRVIGNEIPYEFRNASALMDGQFILSLRAAA